MLASIEWLAAGFEVVQSPYPLWQFRAPDAVAAFGLHGALVVGEPLQVAGRDPGELGPLLECFTATLLRCGERVDSGTGANVLRQSAARPGRARAADRGKPRLPAARGRRAHHDRHDHGRVARRAPVRPGGRSMASWASRLSPWGCSRGGWPRARGPHRIAPEPRAGVVQW